MIYAIDQVHQLFNEKNIVYNSDRRKYVFMYYFVCKNLQLA